MRGIVQHVLKRGGQNLVGQMFHHVQGLHDGGVDLAVEGLLDQLGQDEIQGVGDVVAQGAQGAWDGWIFSEGV